MLLQAVRKLETFGMPLSEVFDVTEKVTGGKMTI
jgi:hypothetical protein